MEWAVRQVTLVVLVAVPVADDVAPDLPPRPFGVVH